MRGRCDGVAIVVEGIRNLIETEVEAGLEIGVEGSGVFGSDAELPGKPKNEGDDVFAGRSTILERAHKMPGVGFGNLKIEQRHFRIITS